MFEVFPADPDDPRSDGAPTLRESLRRVLEHGGADVIEEQRYDLRRAGSEGWVDDDAIVLLVLKAMFESRGYEVLPAGSAEQALHRLEQRGRRPDVVVADYRLREGRTGAEAIRAVRAAVGADVMGIILTGETGAEVQREAAEQELVVIHKPVTPRQLGDALDRLLGG